MSPLQSNIDALDTATPNLAQLLADLCIYKKCTYTYVPLQLSINVLHTATPTARSRTMHIYRRQIDPLPVNSAWMH